MTELQFCQALAEYALFTSGARTIWRDGQWRRDEDKATAAYAACCQLGVWSNEWYRGRGLDPCTGEPVPWVRQ
jgi:hypothetical protein